VSVTIKQRLMRRLRAIVKLAAAESNRVIRRLGSLEEAEKVLRRERCTDRAQWRRWYQANRKWQRQMTALKRLTGRKINPRTCSLPRWVIS
jgi:hypothetical protein